MHLDVSRHFFDVSFIKTYLNMIALHKMNVFHWHLTDDNGWRIEIKKYPELIRKSAWRVDRTKQPWKEQDPILKDEKPTYGGYYTQEEIREVIRYASERNIMVIPEIEMPGHTSEVFAAYPNLSCNNDTLPVQPGTYWPTVDIFCAGNEDVFSFLEDVLTEIVDMFPAPYIHIGGDEAEKTYWKTCQKCQGRIKSEKLKNEGLLTKAKNLQGAGLKMLVMSMTSESNDKVITDQLSIPTISFRSSTFCNGEVEVLYDLLGITSASFLSDKKETDKIQSLGNIEQFIKKIHTRKN